MAWKIFGRRRGGTKLQSVNEDEENQTSAPDELTPLSTTDEVQEARQHRRGISDDSFLREQPDQRHLHRRGRDAMLGLNRSFRTSLKAIAEGVPDNVKEAAEDVKLAFVEKLNEADRGQHFLLDMSLSRGLSILPEDLADLVKDVEQVEELAPAPTVGLAPFLSLLAAIIAISSNGAALSLQIGVSPPMKLYWRMTSTALALFFVGRVWDRSRWPSLTPAQWTTFAMAVCCFVAQGILFVTALAYTSIGNAVLFANSQVLILLAGKVLVGEPISLMEACGALTAFSGAMLCAFDEASQAVGNSEDKDPAAEILGELLALSAALGGVGYLTFAKSIRSHMPVSFFLFLVMFTGSFLVLLYMLVTGSGVEFSAHAYHGMFGWLNWRPDRLLTEVWIVLVCNLVGALGIVQAMQFFDTLIITVATLLEPLMASLIAFYLGVGNLPGLDGWIGNVLVLFGTVGVIYPSIQSGDSVGGH